MATSRERLIHKLNVLKGATDWLNMGIHPSKSQFMTVNANDNLAFVMDSVIVTHRLTDEYVTLRTPISNSKNISDQTDRQIKLKNGHVLKFVSFISKLEISQ